MHIRIDFENDATISSCLQISESFIRRPYQIKSGIKMKKITLSSDATASPPPPPPSPSKSSRKTLIAAILIVIIVVAVVAGVYLMTRNGSTPSTNNPTPAPGTTATPAFGITASPGSGTPSVSEANLIAGATSIQFSVSYTTGTQTVFAYTYSAKNLGTPNMMMRIEGTFSNDSSNTIYIINGAEQKSWVYSDSEWTDMSQIFASQYQTWNETWQGYAENLAAWAGTGEYTYTYPVSGDKLRIYNIAVNPVLADSLFQHS
jgi:hypothetical protein